MQAEEIAFVHDWDELDSYRHQPVLQNPPMIIRWLWLDRIHDYLTGGLLPPPGYGLALLKSARAHIASILAMINRLESLSSRPPLNFDGSGLRGKYTRTMIWKAMR